MDSYFKKWKKENLSDLKYMYNKFILCNTDKFLCSFDRFCIFCYKFSTDSNYS